MGGREADRQQTAQVSDRTPLHSPVCRCRASMDGKENDQIISPGSSRESSDGYSVCSSPEVDVVAFTPRPPGADEEQKRYYCQRCLNHKQLHPRKGHKPFCQFANCECAHCRMVEERRRLNNMLSMRRLDSSSQSMNRVNGGRKVRDPKCALCSAHGDRQPLRGHKKAQCPFLKCGCHLCGLVENRRTLMARQIKLRRDQQKQRKAQLKEKLESNGSPPIRQEKSLVEIREEPLRIQPLIPLPYKPHISSTNTSSHIVTSSAQGAQLFKPAPTQPIQILPQTPTQNMSLLTPCHATPASLIAPSSLFINAMDVADPDKLYLRMMQYQLVTPALNPFSTVFPYAPTLPFLPIP